MAAPDTPEAAPRRWPVRSILVGIVFALVLPGVLFCAVLVDRIATGEQRRSEEAIQATVARVADALDRELGNLGSALTALSTSPALDRGDVAGFDNQARALAAATGQAVVLGDRSGQQLVNTRRAFGTPMPRMQAGPTVKRAIAERQVTVSGLFTGATTGLSVVVMQPVIRGDEVRYLLAISLQPDVLSELLRRQRLPPGWAATVVDWTGRLLALSDQSGLRYGEVMDVGPRRDAGEPVLSDGRSMDGKRVLMAEQWLRLADWRIRIAAPVRDIQAPLRATVLLIGVAGLATLMLAVVLALKLAGWVAGPLQRLADGVREGGPIPLRSTIAEVDAVALALSQAREEAARFTGRLEQQVAARTAQLEEANQLLRDSIAKEARTEEMLRQAQKMEAVGQLTGGIAHDFNNLLTVVIGSLDLLRRRAPVDRQRRLIDNALDGASRAATLTARLLAFSRRHPLQPQQVDLNRLVAGMSDLLRRTIGESVQLETVLAEGTCPAHVDPNQLENALLNLVVNGRDALVSAGRTDGRLMVATGNTVLAGPELDPDVQAGAFVEISVSDTGAGMAPEVADRAFEPFFTTKPQGKGTGLGLSMVHGFVKQSGGQVRIRSTPGVGTVVTLQLPRDDSQPKAEAKPARAGCMAAPHTVLLVEDDAGVRKFSLEALRELGCTVLEADRGEQALRVLETHPEVELLLTDVVLPGMDGRALADEARERWPGLKVLFASGYTDHADAGDALPDGAVLLRKPFTMQLLSAKVQEVLMRPAGLEPATKPL